MAKQNLSNITHSYTAQYLLHQERFFYMFFYVCKNRPENFVLSYKQKKVDKLSNKFKNIIYCTKSDKFMKGICELFLKTVLLPYVPFK